MSIRLTVVWLLLQGQEIVAEKALEAALLLLLLQGQEIVAEKALEAAHKSGGWVFLQNIHLTPSWTGGKKGYLEKRVEKIADGAHTEFRLFLSAEPNDQIPISILQGSIKLTNEPPEGLQANLMRAWSLFGDEMFENSSKQATLFKHHV